MRVDVVGVAGRANLDVVVRPVDRAVRAVHVAGSADAAAGGVVVVAWQAARRGGPLPPLGPVIDAVLARDHPGAVVVVCPGRRVTPPDDVVVAARDGGYGLLWDPAGREPHPVAEALRRAVDSAEPETADGEALAAVLAGGADLAVLAAGLAGHLRAGLTVSVGLTPVVEIAAVDEGEVVEDRPLGVGSGRLHLLRARPLDAAETALLDLVLPVLTLAVRVHEVDRTRAAPARAVLGTVLGDDLVAREAAIRQSRRQRILAERPAVVVAALPFEAPFGREGLERLCRHVESPLRTLDARAVVVPHDGALVFLVGADAGGETVLRTVRRHLAVPLALGASVPIDDLRSLPGAYRQARRAASIGRRSGAVNQLTAYGDLGVVRLLVQLPDHERRTFVAEVLGPAASSGPDAADMRRLLHALRDTHGNIADAARRLFVHRNTVRQRLDRLEAAIGPFLDDPDRRLTVFVALDLHRLDGTY